MSPTASRRRDDTTSLDVKIAVLVDAADAFRVVVRDALEQRVLNPEEDVATPAEAGPKIELLHARVNYESSSEEIVAELNEITTALKDSTGGPDDISLKSRLDHVIVATRCSIDRFTDAERADVVSDFIWLYSKLVVDYEKTRMGQDAALLDSIKHVVIANGTRDDLDAILKYVKIVKARSRTSLPSSTPVPTSGASTATSTPTTASGPLPPTGGAPPPPTGGPSPPTGGAPPPPPPPLKGATPPSTGSKKLPPPPDPLDGTTVSSTSPSSASGAIDTVDEKSETNFRITFANYYLRLVDRDVLLKNRGEPSRATKNKSIGPSELNTTIAYLAYGWLQKCIADNPMDIKMKPPALTPDEASQAQSTYTQGSTVLDADIDALRTEIKKLESTALPELIAARDGYRKKYDYESKSAYALLATTTLVVTAACVQLVDTVRPASKTDSVELKTARLSLYAEVERLVMAVQHMLTNLVGLYEYPIYPITLDDEDTLKEDTKKWIDIVTGEMTLLEQKYERENQRVIDTARRIHETTQEILVDMDNKDKELAAIVDCFFDDKMFNFDATKKTAAPRDSFIQKAWKKAASFLPSIFSGSGSKSAATSATTEDDSDDEDDEDDDGEDISNMELYDSPVTGWKKNLTKHGVPLKEEGEEDDWVTDEEAPDDMKKASLLRSMKLGMTPEQIQRMREIDAHYGGLGLVTDEERDEILTGTNRWLNMATGFLAMGIVAWEAQNVATVVETALAASGGDVMAIVDGLVANASWDMAGRIALALLTNNLGARARYEMVALLRDRVPLLQRSHASETTFAAVSTVFEAILRTDRSAQANFGTFVGRLFQAYTMAPLQRGLSSLWSAATPRVVRENAFLNRSQAVLHAVASQLLWQGVGRLSVSAASEITSLAASNTYLVSTAPDLWEPQIDGSVICRDTRRVWSSVLRDGDQQIMANGLRPALSTWHGLPQIDRDYITSASGGTIWKPHYFRSFVNAIKDGGVLNRAQLFTMAWDMDSQSYALSGDPTLMVYNSFETDLIEGEYRNITCYMKQTPNDDSSLQTAVMCVINRTTARVYETVDYEAYE